jgi:hypothetical protein
MKTIPGFSKYLISEDGEIFSTLSHKILSPFMSDGYKYIKLKNDNGELKHVFIHRLVGFAYLGIPDTDMDINHIDSNRLNNNFSNLEWVTRGDNNRHCQASGRQPKHRVRKLSLDEKLKMAELHKSGIKICILAKMFNVGRTAIVYILSKESVYKEQ